MHKGQVVCVHVQHVQGACRQVVVVWWWQAACSGHSRQGKGIKKCSSSGGK